MQLVSYFFPVVFAIPIFGTYVAQHWLWTFTPSLSYVGQGSFIINPWKSARSLKFTGIIMGFPTTLSMNLVCCFRIGARALLKNKQGMLVGWGILSPISRNFGWAPGPVGDMTTGARGWILWISLAIMCSDSVVSLVPVMWESAQKIVRGRNAPMLQGDSDRDKDDNEFETEDRLVSNRWVLWGLSGSVFVGIVIVWFVFGDEGIKPWATFVGFLMGALLSILGFVRILKPPCELSCDC